MKILRAAVVLLATGLAMRSESARASDLPPRAHVRFITSGLGAPQNFDKLMRVARQLRVHADHVRDPRPDDMRQWVSGPDLVFIETLGLSERSAIKAALRDIRTPWIWISDGVPAFGNIPPLHARRLVGHYVVGGASNVGQMFGYVAAWRSGESVVGFLPPIAFPAAGLYHPAAPGPITAVSDFLNWGQGRWRYGAARVALAVDRHVISGMHTDFVDALIDRGERRGIIPMAFWSDRTDPLGLRTLFHSEPPDVWVIADCGWGWAPGQAEKSGIAVVQIPCGAETARAAASETRAGAARGQGLPNSFTDQVDAVVSKLRDLVAFHPLPPSSRVLH